MDDRKQDEAGALLGTPASMGTGLIGQVRHLSIPLWARILTLLLAVGTLIGGCLLVWQGWVSCTVSCNEKSLENGAKIIGSAFVPVVVLVYLVFAETGIKALVRKTGELLKQTIPNALRVERTDQDFDVAGEIEQCDVETVHIVDAPRARYRMTATRAGEKARLDFVVDLNVSKANVVFFIPAERHAEGADEERLLRERFKPTIEGAKHEGYMFDGPMPEAIVDGRRFVKLVARRKLADNFLWEPGQKLHFAQDLRMFAHSMILDGWEQLIVV